MSKEQKSDGFAAAIRPVSTHAQGSGRTEEILQIDREHIMHPLCPIGQNAGIVFERSYGGVMLQDTEGKEYLDASSQLANVNLGYGRQDILDAAMEQAKKLQFTALYYGYTNPVIAECAQKLAQLTPKALDYFIFTSSGSESNEVALKISRVYWRRKGQNKFKIISLYNSYHGATYGSLSLTGLGGGSFWRNADPIVPGVIHIPPYYCYRCAFGLAYPQCGMRCANFLQDVIQNQGADTVAAFFAEPMQGAGGIIQPPPEYWPIVRRICTENNVLLIADEVMTGFGRTGKMFALEHWNTVPDIMTVSKGITSGYFPFGAAVIGNHVREPFEGTVFVHGSTYCGHPTCAAAAVKTMDIYIQEKIVEHAAEMGRHALERLEREFLPLPHVGAVSGLGLFIGLEIVGDKAKKSMPAPQVMPKLQREFRDDGVWIRFGANRFHIAPPLVITREQLDCILDVMKSGIANLE